jgi:PKHD-type hydroxylase
MIACIPDLLTPEELKVCRDLAAGALFVDGRETATSRGRNAKRNEQISKQDESRKPIQALIVAALYRHPAIRRAAIPHRIRPPLISRYGPGQYYARHCDAALMGPADNRTRSDISCTIFLSDRSEYAGGELLIEWGLEPQKIKLPAGHAVIYPASTLHQVAEVTSGERLAAVTWIQSYVRDPERRQILADLALVRDRLKAVDPDARETELAIQARANLLRMWSEN